MSGLLRALQSLSQRVVGACLKHDLTSRLFAKLVVDVDKTRRVDVRGRALRFSIGSSSIDETLSASDAGGCRFEARERETFDFLDRHLADGDVFYDIGANFGMYVAYAARRAQLRHLVALEPEALNFAELCRNIRLNGLQQVTALCIGAGDRPSFEAYRLRAFMAGNHSGRTRRYLGGEGVDAPTPADGFVADYLQKIQLMPLDGLIQAAALAPPTILLMDIDGGELHALAGMAATLANPALRAVAIETGNAEESAPVQATMTAQGFRCTGRSDGRRANAFFVRR